MFGLLSSSKKETKLEGPSTLMIKSQDIDLKKFSESNIVEMRKRFPDVYDDVLARYLIARNDDLEKACEQYNRALDWKAKHYPVLKVNCLKEVNSGKLYVRGVDKEGRPLLIFRSRFSFPKTRDLEETAKMLVWFAEHLQRRLPSHLTKYTLLMDRTEFKSENNDNELIKHCSGPFSVSSPVPFFIFSILIAIPSSVLFFVYLSLRLRIYSRRLCSAPLSTPPMWCSTLFGLW
jgi:hypothetical protein